MDTKIIMGVVAGMAMFGLIMWGIKQLPPGNVVTDTLKKASDIASTS